MAVFLVFRLGSLDSDFIDADCNTGILDSDLMLGVSGAVLYWIGLYLCPTT